MPHPQPDPSPVPDPDDLLSIGDLAARSGLSAKALRMYDESGLLPPRQVDPFTGYRSYGADQVRRARLIAALRGLGMGLARIQVLCDLEPEAASWELRSWWRQEQADALSRAGAVDDLVRTLGERPEEATMSTVDTITAEIRPIRHGSALDRGTVRPTQQDATLTRDLPGGTVLLAVADGFGPDDGLAGRLLGALVHRLDDALSAQVADEGCCPDLLGALQVAWCAVEAELPGAEIADGHAGAASEAGGAGASRPDGATGVAPAVSAPGTASSADAPGSTLTAVLLQGDQLACAHLGDTRALLVRGDRVDPITQDHTRVRSLLAAGRLSPEEAAAHPDRAILNRALAAGSPTAPDLLLRRLEPGDTVVVLSDGVHAVVDPAVLADALTGGSPSGAGGHASAEADGSGRAAGGEEDGTSVGGDRSSTAGDSAASSRARRIVDLALAAGGPDNAAAAVAEVGAAPGCC